MSDRQGGLGLGRGEALPLLSVLGLLLFLLAHTWLKWGDLIIDTGRELCVPLDLLSGKVLYRDVFYLYGPFSPYWNAGLMRLFGGGLMALVLSGVLTTGVIAWVLFRVCRLFLGPWESALCASAYLVLLAFAHYEPLGIFTHVLPYAFPSIHGTALSLGAVYGALAWARGRRRSSLVLSALLAFLALLTRVEMGLMALAAMAAASWSAGRVRSGFSLLSWVLAPLTAAVLVYAAFWGAARGALAGSGLFGIWAANFDPGRAMTGWVLGTADLGRNLKLLAGGLVLHGLVFAAAGMGALQAQARLAEGRKALAWASGAVGLALAGLAACYGAGFDAQYRVLPLVLAWLGAPALSRLARRQGREEDPLVLTLSLFALLFCGRMLFNVRPGHYGSHLLVPGLAAYFVALFRAAPGAFASLAGAPAPGERRTAAPGSFAEFEGTSSPGRRFFGWGMAVFLAVSTACYFQVSERFYRLRTLRIESPRGGLLVLDDDRGRRNLALIEFLRAHAAPGDTLAVFPEGLGLNFFSGLANPLHHYSYLPVDLSSPGVEESVAEGLGARRVAWAAVVQRPTGEYGAGFFGGDYGLAIRDRLLSDYEPAMGFGPPPFATPAYGIALFRRKPGP